MVPAPCITFKQTVNNVLDKRVPLPRVVSNAITDQQPIDEKAVTERSGNLMTEGSVVSEEAYDSSSQCSYTQRDRTVNASH